MKLERVQPLHSARHGPLLARLPQNGSVEMHKIVLLRHGESVWNKENLFTGWTDVDLSDKGTTRGQGGGPHT